MKQTMLVILGAVAGGVLGYFAFFWVVQQGLYALILPGGLLGVGAGVARHRSMFLAIACGLAALALGILTEWRYAPFVADESLGYFLANISKLKADTLLMIGLGGAIGFWVPFRRRG